jgi:hypothetical protein
MWHRKRDAETESFEEMIDAYMRLQFIDPGHELVGLATYDPEKKEFTYSDKFNEMFVHSKKGGFIGMHRRYTRALKNAAEGKPYRPHHTA